MSVYISLSYMYINIINHKKRESELNSKLSLFYLVIDKILYLVTPAGA